MTDIFISYSHIDEAWKDKLQAPLRALQLHNDFEVWDDRQIELGDNWLPEIEKAIEQARVAVLLVSNDFLMSDFVVEKEIPSLLRRRAEKGLRMVPVVVRPCPWQGVPWLAELQGATKDNQPLSSLQGEHAQEDVLSKVAMKIFGLLEDSRQEAADSRPKRPKPITVHEPKQASVKDKPVLRHRVENTEKIQKQALVGGGTAGSLGKAWLGVMVLIISGLAYVGYNLEIVAGLMDDTQPQAQSQASLAKPVQSDAPEPVVAESADNPVAENKPEAEPTQIIELPHGMKLVKIPRGSFQMGSSNSSAVDEKPVHTVAINYDFWMSQSEVTFEQYDAYAEADGKNKPDDAGWGRKNRPVIHVSWNGAQEYVKWLSTNNKQNLQCRLPSEAEWEYAARSGTTTQYPWGDVGSHVYANFGKDIMNCCEGVANGQDQWVNTAPVGQFPTNKFDLHDMHGNVWEWVQDCWHSNYQGASVDGSARELAQCDFRILRGGSWSNAPYVLRSANRLKNTSDLLVNNVGFRVVCSPH